MPAYTAAELDGFDLPAHKITVFDLILRIKSAFADANHGALKMLLHQTWLLLLFFWRNMLPRPIKHFRKLMVMLFHHIPVVDFGSNGLKVAIQTKCKCHFLATCCTSRPECTVAVRKRSSVIPSILPRRGASWVPLV